MMPILKRRSSLFAAPLEPLLVKYGEGDTEAFDEFYRRTRKLVFSFIKRRISQRLDVDEVFQETYFRVHRYIATYDSSQGAVVWLLTIARNAAVDQHKAMCRNDLPEKVQINLEQEVIGPKEFAEFRDLLAKACCDLRPDELQLLTDRVLREESFDEISQNRGITAQNARQQFSRLLRKIRSTFPA